MTALPQPYVTTRTDIINELFESEKNFYKDLEYMCDTIHPGFAAARAVPENHALCETIFGGIPPIRKLSQKLVILLEKARIEHPDDPYVSEAFITTASDFVAFSQYVSNQPQALKSYQDALTDRRTEDGMKILFASKQAHARKPEDIFALPYQRLCRYGLFLDRIIKATPQAHPERESLLFASRKMQEMVGLVNSICGEHERKLKLKAVAALLEFSGSYPQFDVVVPGREIVYHGPLSKIRMLFNKPLHFFIFSDIIVYALEVTSLFRPTRYCVEGVYKLDQYFKVTRHDKQSDTKHWLSIFTTVQHLGKHYDALTKQNYEQMMTAFTEVITNWTIQFIQKQAKDRLDKKLQRDRAICALCPRPLSKYGRNSCPFCSQNICSDCFNCQFAQKQCCAKCGEQRGIVPINTRLVPRFRAYKAITSYNLNASRMVELKEGDELEVYLQVNQRWALGKNVTSNKVGCFPLGSCKLDMTRDQGENQNFGLFAGVFEPQNRPGAKNTFAQLDVGDVIVITWDNGDGWYYGMSLATGRFGYIHYTDLVVVKNTEILRRKYQ